jgi:hypothetical protein
MTREQLISEIKEVEKAYYQECNDHGGKEGTTFSYGLRMQLSALTGLLEKYFEEEYIYNRMIF